MTRTTGSYHKVGVGGQITLPKAVKELGWKHKTKLLVESKKGILVITLLIVLICGCSDNTAPPFSLELSGTNCSIPCVDYYGLSCDWDSIQCRSAPTIPTTTLPEITACDMNGCYYQQGDRLIYIYTYSLNGSLVPTGAIVQGQSTKPEQEKENNSEGFIKHFIKSLL